MVSDPATRSAHPGFESRPGTSPRGGLRGGRSHCEYCKNKLIKKTRPRLAVSETKFSPENVLNKRQAPGFYETLSFS